MSNWKNPKIIVGNVAKGDFTSLAWTSKPKSGKS